MTQFNDAISSFKVSPKTTAEPQTNTDIVLRWLADNPDAMRNTTLTELAKKPFNIGLTEISIKSVLSYLRVQKMLINTPRKNASHNCRTDYFLNYWHKKMPHGFLNEAPLELRKEAAKYADILPKEKPQPKLFDMPTPPKKMQTHLLKMSKLTFLLPIAPLPLLLLSTLANEKPRPDWAGLSR